MFSLQTIFGQGKQFFSFLDDAAVAAHDSTKALHSMMKTADRQPALRRRLMLTRIATGVVGGVLFLLLGAWPVFGFFGLDVLLIYGAFRLNYRAARAREEITPSAPRRDRRASPFSREAGIRARPRRCRSRRCASRRRRRSGRRRR